MYSQLKTRTEILAFILDKVNLEGKSAKTSIKGHLYYPKKDRSTLQSDSEITLSL